MSPGAIDYLPAFCSARVLLLGVGNPLFGDDGFGPAVVTRLGLHYQFPDWLYVMDVGTGAARLLHTLLLSEHLPEQIIIVDAVDGGAGDHRLGEIPLGDLPEPNPEAMRQPHLPAAHLFRQLQQERGVTIRVLACDVGELPPLVQTGLSVGAQRAVNEAAEWLAGELELAPQRAAEGRGAGKEPP